MTMSDRALVQKQKDVIKLQDEMLLDIESGVGRLHEKVASFPFSFPFSLNLCFIGIRNRCGGKGSHTFIG